jgi:hypothetical protein
MEEDTVQSNYGENKTEKFRQENHVFSGCLILEKKQQLGWQKFHD